jgi:hypothetical protein
MKSKWNLIDNSFGNSSSAVAGVCSTYSFWNRDEVDENCSSFYVNGCIYRIREKDVSKKMSYGFLLESAAIIPEVYKHAYRVVNNFNLFFTHNSELLKYSNARWIPGGGVWIGGKYGKGEIKIFEKNKMISMVSSDKRMCALHEFRLQVLEAVSSFQNVDILGTAVTGWIPIHQSLEDYMFSIVIENYVDNLYFTEKINNCFATGTIPIYYGARHIDKIYNPEGIITFSTISELVGIINNLNEDEYYKRMNALKDNHEICKQYISIEDYIYNNYLVANCQPIANIKTNAFQNSLSDFCRRNIHLIKDLFIKYSEKIKLITS